LAPIAVAFTALAFAPNPYVEAAAALADNKSPTAEPVSTAFELMPISMCVLPALVVGKARAGHSPNRSPRLGEQF
jgi:hypothetical protein